MYSDVDFPQNDEIQKQEIWNNFRKSLESKRPKGAKDEIKEAQRASI